MELLIERAKHIKEIKESLNALERAKVVDAYRDQSDIEKVSSQYGGKRLPKNLCIHYVLKLLIK